MSHFLQIVINSEDCSSTPYWILESDNRSDPRTTPVASCDFLVFCWEQPFVLGFVEQPALLTGVWLGSITRENLKLILTIDRKVGQGFEPFAFLEANRYRILSVSLPNNCYTFPLC